MRNRTWLWRAVVASAAILLAIRLWPHPRLQDQVPQSTSIWSAEGELLRATLASDQQYRIWVPLRDISPELVGAFLLKEDRWFYLHPGVNPVSLMRAAFRTWRGQARQGGSTLTMQVARLLYRQNTRTPLGKVKQIAAALWLEARYSKRSILEAYLNLAPFGGNLHGVAAASRVYFGKPPSQVTLGEAATLAVIPQRPAARPGRGANQQDLLAARARLVDLYLRKRRVTDSDRRQLELPVTGLRFPMPMLAPHFTDAILLAGRGRSGRIQTTLDAGIQRLIEKQIEVHLKEQSARGIRNASALLIDYHDMSVKAWVGSADYFNEAIQGQVNGVLAKRSPGSTLKPFIYALGIDQGILHPRTILRDAPTSFGPFTPENFDGDFAGPLPAQDALIRSRNVPAVWIASQLRQPSLYQFLQSAGIGKLRPESFYGLALALGGGELTMEELAGLYAMLANQGLLRPIRLLASDPLPEGVRLLSPEASFITLDMLRHNPRPGEDPSLAPPNRWPVAWKTGTSWGFRDAWSAGIVGPYVLVVWIGEFEGQSNLSFIGATAAAPLFFRIADALQHREPHRTIAVPGPPPGVKRVEVCAESGDLPNKYCPQTLETWYIPGKSPIRVSQLHRAVVVDARTGRPVCPPYDPAFTRQEVFEFWPTDMLRLFRKAGMPRRQPPALPDCAVDATGDPPRISTPLRNVTYALRRKPQPETIPLEAGLAADVSTVFWFDGPVLIAKASADEGAVRWAPPTDGVHLIRVIDDHGRTAEREVLVRFIN